MLKPMYLAAVIGIAAVLLSPQAVLSVRAPAEIETTSGEIVAAAASGTAGRIAKFTNGTDLGNSILHQNGSNIGIGTTTPLARVDIRARNALSLMGAQPNLTLRDTGAGDARHRIVSANGGLSLQSESFLNGSNPAAFVQVDREGRVGFGTASPLRAIQIGSSNDSAFTLEPSEANAIAGHIRFGDNTGWNLVFGRQRESSAGPLNQGFTGTVMQIRDDAAFRLLAFPLGATGTLPLCARVDGFITNCQASSLRYKADIEPYRGGLDVVDRLEPIAFTRILSGDDDIGLAAEAVEQVDPRLTYYNAEGEVEGVRYELLSAVLINALKEQQQQLQRQQQLIEELQAAVARLETGRL